MATYTIEIVVQGKDDASGAFSGVQKGLNDIKNTADSSGRGIGGFFRDAFSFATGGLISAGIGKIKDSIGGLIGGMVGGNAAFEDYNTRFTTLLGSSDKAKERLAALADFGARTPFELPQVVDADIILQGFGLHSEETAKRFGFSGEQIRTIAGDVASGTGSSFSEMTLLLGKFSTGATGEAISRMAELGITSRDELTKMGLEFSKSGQLLTPLPQAMNTVLKLMKDKYGGLMDAQSSTFNGMVSNLQDWVAGTLRTIGQPIFEILKDKLGILLQFLGSDEVKGAITAFTQFLVTGIGQTIDFIGNTVIPAFVNAWVSVQPALNAIVDLWNSSLRPVFDQIVAFIMANIQPILTGLAAVLLTVVVPALIAWAVAAGSAALATIVALAPVLIPLAAIGAAVALLRAAWDSDFGSIRTTLTDFWTNTGQPIFNTVKEWLAVNIPIAIGVVSGFFTGTFLPAVNVVWAFVRDQLIPILVTIAVETFGTLKAGIQTLAGFWTGTLWPALQTVWGFLNTYIIPILRALAEVEIALVIRAVRELANFWTSTLQPALNTVWSFINGSVIPVLQRLVSDGTEKVKAGAGAMSDIFNGTVKPAFDTIAGVLNTALRPAFDGLKGVIDGVNSAIGAISGIVQGAIGWLNRLADAIRGVPSMPNVGGGGGSGGAFASGTLFAPGGMALVGERGPELVSLPRGSQVFDARTSRSMMMGGGVTHNYYINANYAHQDERRLRDDIRTLQMLTGG